jgi:hypothetical protein
MIYWLGVVNDISRHRSVSFCVLIRRKRGIEKALQGPRDKETQIEGRCTARHNVGATWVFFFFRKRKNNSSRYEIHDNKSNLFPFFAFSHPHFDRLPFSALIFVRKTFSFFVYFMLRVSYDLYTQVSIFLFCLFYKTRRKEKVSLFFSFLCSVEEIKNNKLFWIGKKWKKILLYNIFHFECVYVCVRKEQVRKKRAKRKDRWNKIKKNTLIYFYL